MKSPVYNYYPSFVPNQVLSDSQLNDLRAFLDEQGRLTRTQLIGCGIVCGLNVRAITVQDKQDNDRLEIHISEGYGISSDGHLLQLDSDTEYKYFRPYSGLDSNQDNIEDYDAWQNIEEPIYELVKGADDDQQEKDVKYLRNEFIDGRVLVMYLEKRLEDQRSCSVVDCSNTGVKVKFVPRFLLVHEGDLTAPGNDDCLISKPGDESPSPIGAVYVSRFHTHIYDDCDPEVPLTIYDIDNTRQINCAFGTIAKNISQELFIQLGYINTNNLDEGDFLNVGDLTDRIGKIVEVIPAGRSTTSFNQYHYDFVVDLSCAYNEFLEVYCKLVRYCCKDYDFECHLFLSRLVDPLNEDNKRFRHSFLPSPVRDTYYDDWARTRGLLLRLIAMIDSFDRDSFYQYSDLRNEENFPHILITPSHTADTKIGERAVPVYYRERITAGDGSGAFVVPKSIESYWQPKECCTIDPLLSYTYQASPEEEIADDELTLQSAPLQFNIDKNSFLRIEGHLGKSCDIVVEALCKLKRDHNLPFDIVVLFLPEADTTDGDMTTIIGGLAAKIERCDEVRIGLYSEWIEQLKGIEHTGGVSPGGTLVLVCDPRCPIGNNLEDVDDGIVADFSLPHAVACCLDITDSRRPSDLFDLEVSVVTQEVNTGALQPVGGAFVVLHQVLAKTNDPTSVIDIKEITATTPREEGTGTPIGTVVFPNLGLFDESETAGTTVDTYQYYYYVTANKLDGNSVYIPIEEISADVPPELVYTIPSGLRYGDLIDTTGISDSGNLSHQLVLSGQEVEAASFGADAQQVQIKQVAPPAGAAQQQTTAAASTRRTTAAKKVEVDPEAGRALIESRRQGYIQNIDNLNSTGDFSRNRTYGATHTFVLTAHNDPKNIHAAFKETIGKIKSVIRRTSTGPKGLAYQRMASLSMYTYLDQLVSMDSANLSAEASEIIQAEVKALKDLDMQMSQIKNGWQSSALSNALGTGTVQSINTLLA